MSDNTVYYRGTKAEAKAAVRRVVGMATGRVPDEIGIKKGMALAVGVAALSDIKDDFLRKSEGHTGQDGVMWDPLSPEYLAYGRRFGRGEQSALKRHAGVGRGQNRGIGENTGLLSASEKKRWQFLFASRLQRLLLSMDPKAAKARAAQIAWATIKREGAQTKLGVFGHRDVLLLRDTGALFNSLSPGELSGSGVNVGYSKPSGDGGEQQIMELLTRGVIVGTNVSYASAQNARRRFIPANDNVPAVWWSRWAVRANEALFAGIRFGLQVGM